jgi:8-oxo-dGTP pyrophosphatase MutT (NUDIX family)
MKKNSCGAILYTISERRIYIILGMEKGEWYPFKGSKEGDETYEETAIREVYEETCKLVTVDDINLQCHYSTKRKNYHIGLVKVEPSIMVKFNKNRASCSNKAYKEKTALRMFELDNITKYAFHFITQKPISYYYNELKRIQYHHRTAGKSIKKKIKSYDRPYKSLTS